MSFVAGGKVRFSAPEDSRLVFLPQTGIFVPMKDTLPAMNVFPYGAAETRYLSRRDPRLGRVIEAIGPVVRPVWPDLFGALCRSIIGQQISNRAAATVVERFDALLGEPTPQRVLEADPSALRSCGMSLRKVGYIRSAAAAVLDGTLDVAALRELPDAEVVRKLTALPGIGVWTAEMLMIFSLQRPDVLSYDDLIVRRSLMRLHGLSGLDRTRFAAFRERYSPFGSVASLYLWEMAAEPWRDLVRCGPDGVEVVGTQREER